MIVRAPTLRLIRGAPSVWSRATALGDVLECRFCPDCGTRLWHQGVKTSRFLSVKGGTLDVPPDLSDVVHIHTAGKMPGVVIPPDAVQFPGEPPHD